MQKRAPDGNWSPSTGQYGTPRGVVDSPSADSGRAADRLSRATLGDPDLADPQVSDDEPEQVEPEEAGDGDREEEPEPVSPASAEPVGERRG